MKKYLLKVLIWIPVIIMAGIIFGFSKQDGDESQGLSNKVADVILTGCDKCGFINYIDNSPDKKAEMVANIQYPIRKGAHMSEYAILTMLILLALFVDGVRRKIYLYAWGLATAFAATDEIHQLFVPDRAGQVVDVLIDSFGCIIGLLFIYIIVRIKACNSRKNVV